jgi:hypothetical protein
MRRIVKYLGLVMAASPALFAPAWAADPCAELPTAVATYLSANPGWSVITADDLARDDRRLWLRQHRHECPGFALADLDGSGRPFAALGLINHRLGNDSERVVLVRPAAGELEVRVLVPDERVYHPLTLFRRPPGMAKDWDDEKAVAIAHDSVGVAWLEASARQYFWDKGSFRCVQASD